MVSPELFVKTLQANGVDFFAGVPDSLLKNVCAYITDNVGSDSNIITANEGTAIGVAAGHYLATGCIPMVYMQNSGLGNTVNPLLSLADELVYSIPIVLMIGWRGEPGVHDEPQHAKQGKVTLPLLEAMQIPYVVLPEEDKAAIEAVKTILDDCQRLSKPHAIVIRKNTFGKYKLQKEAVNKYPLSREEALKIVAGNLPSDSIIISTTGKLSRELYEFREVQGQSHNSDFLTVGSMGHASSIALGIALETQKKVFCFDGDGAFIMHMGALTNIGNLAPKNLVHILFNNGAHESVGAQPTLGFDIDIPAIAKACGYTQTYSVSEKENLENTIKNAIHSNGPVLIEIKVGINSRENLGRPKTAPADNKIALMRFITK